jgi:hypothetical protein
MLTTKEESNAAKTTARYALWCVPFILPSARAAFRSLSFGTDVTRLMLQVFDSGPCMWLRKVAKDNGFEYVEHEYVEHVVFIKKKFKDAD